MSKRSLLWFSSFFILIILNLFITVAYVDKVKRDHQALRILDEIDRSYPAPGELTKYQPSRLKNFEAEVSVTDGRVANLKKFFREYNSPLFDYAGYIVK